MYKEMMQIVLRNFIKDHLLDVGIEAKEVPSDVKRTLRKMTREYLSRKNKKRSQVDPLINHQPTINGDSKHACRKSQSCYNNG